MYIITRGESRNFYNVQSRKKIEFQNNWLQEQAKNTDAKFKAKITKHDKKKNDKDEIGNILLKHVLTCL